MAEDRDGPFTTLESAHEFVSLLREAVDEAYGTIIDETAQAHAAGADRRIDALRLVDHKLNSLRQHVLASLILINDLRSLRRLLLGERRRANGHDDDRQPETLSHLR
jgi:hypothetical protein